MTDYMTDYVDVSYSRLRGVLRDCHYRDWFFDQRRTGLDMQLCVVFYAQDNFGIGSAELQYGRWWSIPFDADETYIKRIAFAAVLAAQEHETREQFTYKGETIFNPHQES